MKTIYKYPIYPADYVEVEMPAGAEILTVQLQRNQLCLWALVDSAAPVRKCRFRIAGTGHPLDDEVVASKYVGTFQLNDGQFVFHVFQIN